MENTIAQDQPTNIESSFKSTNPGYVPPQKTTKKTILYVLLGLVIAALVFAGAYYFVSQSNKDVEFLSPLSKDQGLGIDIPDQVVNPITGEMVAGKNAEEWYVRRPLAVMMNNHIDARPQSGLIYADITYEVVAEGGITRFLPFYLASTPEKIGPVRSTREYYLVLVKELGDAMLMHIGWSPQALEAIESWPVRSLGRGGATFWRDNPRNVASEHTAYVNGEELYEKGLELGWEGNRPLDTWTFRDADKYTDAAPATDITVDFWYEGDYSAIWKYDPASKVYLRHTGYDAAGEPIPHMDQEETTEQVKVTNLIVQFAEELSISGDDKNRLEYELIGSGDALIFMEGKVVAATWSKAERDERTMFYDTNGEEMEFARGKFWVSIVPSRNADQVIYN